MSGPIAPPAPAPAPASKVPAASRPTAAATPTATNTLLVVERLEGDADGGGKEKMYMCEVDYCFVR